MKEASATPPRNWGQYARALERVLERIEASVESGAHGDRLDLEALAAVACLSPFHFHRVFHSMLGETVHGAVQRIRLQRVAWHLANGDAPLAAIATRCGFSSAAPLVRAFKAHYGITPAAYRKAGPHQAYRRKPSEPGDSSLSVEVREAAAFELVVCAHRGPYIRVGEAFERCWLHASAQVRRAGGAAFMPTRAVAVYLDDPAGVSSSMLRAWVGYATDRSHEWALPLQKWQVPAGRVAVLRYRGPYASMHAAYRWLFGQWLPHSGEAPGDHPVYEDYLNHPRDTAPADLLTDICLPLR